jgi:hypothetical protein
MQHLSKFRLNDLGMKKSYWYVLGSLSVAIVLSLVYFKLRKASDVPQPMAHTLEYNNVVDEHIDTTKLPRSEIDFAVSKQEISERFAVYQFNHPKLRGKWGNLNVLVDRQTGKSVSRSLLPVNKAQPAFTLSSVPECVNVEQPAQKNYEICLN